MTALKTRPKSPPSFLVFFKALFRRNLASIRRGSFLPSKFDEKVLNRIVRVTRDEADEIRKKLPGEHIAITNRQKSNKHYYAVESRPVKALLRKLRERSVR